MTTNQKVVIIAVFILVTLMTLSLAAGDKPAELEGYSSLEIGLGLLYISSPFWFPLALALALMPRRR